MNEFYVKFFYVIGKARRYQVSYPACDQVLLVHPYSIGRFVIIFASVYASDLADLA